MDGNALACDEIYYEITSLSQVYTYTILNINSKEIGQLHPGYNQYIRGYIFKRGIYWESWVMHDSDINDESYIRIDSHFRYKPTIENVGSKIVSFAIGPVNKLVCKIWGR